MKDQELKGIEILSSHYYLGHELRAIKCDGKIYLILDTFPLGEFDTIEHAFHFISNKLLEIFIDSIPKYARYKKSVQSRFE